MTASPTTDSYRDQIDAGETGDKVAFPDPAAAPLGTDDEAAGTKPQTPPKATRPSPVAESNRPKAPAPLLYGVITIVLAAAFVLVAWQALA